MVEYITIEDGWTMPSPSQNEDERLSYLYSLGILDTDNDNSFDQIAVSISKLLDVPISLISFVDKDRQWFKSCIGIDDHQTPRNVSFCAHAVATKEHLYVADTYEDDRFRNNPLVIEEPHIRFYYGIPLISNNGYALGTLCAIDTKPRFDVTDEQIHIMTSFANLVVKLLELRISHKKVENADTSKSAFFASMSHEIRTPMNGIIGAATLLKNSDPNDTQSRYIDTILSSGRMLLEIIDELLDFAKIENNSLPLHITSFNLRRACEQQVDLLQTIAQEKNIELSLTFDDNIPDIVKLDETRIKQILSNLIGNAIKFTDPNGEVHLSLTQLEHDRLKIEVRDNGAGIAEKKLDKIFTAYQQILEHRKKTNKTGTGLGLAITKHLVERMNGTIDVESKIGVGTKFTIMLPYEIGTKEEEILSGYDTPNLKDINLDAHVLLVEDVLTNQFIISNILEKLGCHVDIADNGKVALDKIQQVEYDLVFMDCNMPEMDGYEATRLIRKLTNIKQPRIIALTAHAFKEDEEKCLKAGMDTFMTKPLEINKVIQILNE